MNKRKTANRIAVIMVTFAVTFTFMPAAAGSLDADAAAPYWRSYKAAQKNTAVRVSWKKLTKAQQKKITGIVVYRNGKAVKKLKKTAASYTDAKVKAGRTYKYSLKTYRKTMKKVRVYYNKKTKKWQTKKISGAKTKLLKKTKYVYRNASPVKKIKVKAVKKASEDAAAPSEQAGADTGKSAAESKSSEKQSSSGAGSKSDASTDSGKTHSGSTSGSTQPSSQGSASQPSSGSNTSGTSASQSSTSGGGSESGASETEPVIPTSGGDEPGDSTEPETEPEVTYTGNTKSISNYKGDTTTLYKELSNGMWEYNDTDRGNTYTGTESYDSMMARINNPYYNHLIDGEFDSNDGHMIQRNGATFKVYPEIYRDIGCECIQVDAYNADPDKLEIKVSNYPVETYRTYTYEQDPVNASYIMNGNKRLLKFSNKYNDKTQGNKLSRVIAFSANRGWDTDGTGFTKGTIEFTASYDGYELNTWEYEVNPDGIYVDSPYADYLSPERYELYQIALTAVENYDNTNYYTEYDKDMYAIKAYLSKNYTENQYSCIGGTAMLETFSIVKYGVTGFASYGSYGNPTTNPNHYAFHLDSDPSVYYEARGNKK